MGWIKTNLSSPADFLLSNQSTIFCHFCIKPLPYYISPSNIYIPLKHPPFPVSVSSNTRSYLMSKKQGTRKRSLEFLVPRSGDGKGEGKAEAKKEKWMFPYYFFFG